MENSHIFVATNDPDLKIASAVAAFESGLQGYNASNLAQANDLLSSNAQKVCLAVIGLELQGGGATLLNILGTCATQFPILVIGNANHLARENFIRNIATAVCVRPVAAGSMFRIFKGLFRKGVGQRVRN